MELNRNELISVGTAAIVVSDERNNMNQPRVSITIVNTSTAGQVITLAVDNEAKTGKGIQLAVGGSFTDSRDSLYYPTQKYITAISDAANGQISLQERIGL